MTMARRMNAGSSWRDDFNLFRRRHRHVQFLGRHLLDKGVLGPRALLELELAPLDVEVVAVRIQLLELHEHLTRAVLAVNRARGRAERPEPEDRDCEQEHLAGEKIHTIFSATRNSALRARGFLSTSASAARALRPTSFRRGCASGGRTGRSRSAGSTSDSRFMNCLTRRSSSEWKLMTA